MVGLQARLDQLQKQQEPLTLMMKHLRQHDETLDSIKKLTQDHANYISLTKSLHHENISLLKQEAQLFTDMANSCQKIKNF